jgi:hypothetical protein
MQVLLPQEERQEEGVHQAQALQVSADDLRILALIVHGEEHLAYPRAELRRQSANQ